MAPWRTVTVGHLRSFGPSLAPSGLQTFERARVAATPLRGMTWVAPHDLCAYTMRISFGGARVPAKKAVNVSVPAELLDAARAEDINLSAALETALAEQLRIRRREKWLAENSGAIAAYNREIAEHGAFGDKVRSF